MLQVNKFREALPQLVACMIKNLLIFNVGLAYGFPTIVIPVMRGLLQDRNPGETLHFTAEQSSWYGSITPLTEPFASLLSGWFTDKLGRRRTMLLVNLPPIIAWTLMYTAASIAEVFVAGVLLGLGIGLSESCVHAYIGEISQPSIRGPLLVLSNLSGMLGVVTMYMGGALLPWRTAALCALGVPCCAICAIFFLPETPYWLLVNNRPADALRSLQWLRGWVPEDNVRAEYTEIAEFVTKTNVCRDCALATRGQCQHPSGYFARCLELVQPKTWRPLCIVAVCFVLSHNCGMAAMRPFLVQLVTVFRVPVDASRFSVAVGLVELSAFVMVLLVLQFTGKRRLFLMATGISALANFVLAVHAFVLFPAGVSSFDADYVRAVRAGGEMDNWFACVVLLVMAFAAGTAAGVPWMLLSELYPIRVRAASCALSAAFCYLSLFASTKTYLFLERSLSIGGAFMFYVIAASITWTIVYRILPETEGRSLPEIEAHFSDPDHRLTRRHIKRHQSSA